MIARLVATAMPLSAPSVVPLAISMSPVPHQLDRVLGEVVHLVGVLLADHVEMAL